MQLEASDLRALFTGNATPISMGFVRGMKVCIRCITYHHCGIVERVGDGIVELSGASWIAESGRWEEFTRTGDAEVREMFAANVRVSLGAIVDWTEMPAIPTTTK